MMAIAGVCRQSGKVEDVYLPPYLGGCSRIDR
jgi:hypothetical protein